MTAADKILNKTYRTLGLETASFKEKYKKIDKIVTHLAAINAKKPINVKTTGTISERLCELAIKATSENYYDTLPKEWKWLGDFSIFGSPFNIIVSVKSFKAKERLMASGSGGILTPTVGWGLFDDPSEWGKDRVISYLHRAFIAIYLPKTTLRRIPRSSRNIKNINGKPFLRKLDNFMSDIKKAKIGTYVDIRKY
ncbi:MAG: hypothetical protein ACXACY_29170 [Candidatus Hodarchaeales archaeon]|jgi:hypothetical protein